VIGSRNPWVEACVLEAAAPEIETLEYSAINSKHPQLKTMVPLEFRRNYLENILEKFDAVATFNIFSLIVFDHPWCTHPSVLVESLWEPSVFHALNQEPNHVYIFFLKT
jgi:hypothetical protein